MDIDTDALIVGAGPCGLFQVFELGLLGLSAHVVDSMPVVGGQCAELYPDKPIYDIPAIPVCTGEELVTALMAQIEPFAPQFHLGDEVREVVPQDEGGFRVVTSQGKVFNARTIFVAGGVGSFQPRRMRVEGIDKFESAQLHYRVRNPDQFKDKRVAVFGAGDSAFDWALELAPIAKSLTLVHRSDQFRAAPASVDKFRALATAGDVDIIEFGTASGFVADDGRLTGVEVQVKNGEARVLEIDHVLAFFGLAPKLGPIAEWGLDIRKKTIDVNPEDFQTNIPGIFAIGDICQYPGKKKLILSGFHEAALAAFAAKAIVEPGRKVHLQYTTTSPIMHKRLGIDDE